MGSSTYHAGTDVQAKVAARIESDSAIPSPKPDEIRSYSAEEVMALEQGRVQGSVRSSQHGPSPMKDTGPASSTGSRNVPPPENYGGRQNFQ